jgi:nucleoside-diphosphate-sugar epimerase
MRTLVTGATGRVGSRLVHRLSESGATVRVLVRDGDRAAQMWNGGLDVVVGDLRDPDVAKQAVSGVDAVVHLAAAFRGVDDEQAMAVNRAAAVDTAAAARDAGVRRFLFVSTNLVYGPGRGRPARESDEPRPAGTYPTGKAQAERALRDMQAAAGFGLRVVRLAFVYGEGDPHLAESLRWAREWPAHQRLHLVHHADVARGLLLVLQASDVDGRVYNLADDAPVTAWELLALQGEQHAGGAGEVDPWAGVVDTGRIREELGFRPRYPTVYAAQAAGVL